MLRGAQGGCPQAQRSTAVPGPQELPHAQWYSIDNGLMNFMRTVMLYGIHLIMVNHVEGKRLETRRVGV